MHFYPYSNERLSVLVCKRYQRTLPSIFQSFFSTNIDVSWRNIRHSDLLRMPEGKLSVRRTTVIQWR